VQLHSPWWSVVSSFFWFLQFWSVAITLHINCRWYNEFCWKQKCERKVMWNGVLCLHLVKIPLTSYSVVLRYSLSSVCNIWPDLSVPEIMWFSLYVVTKFGENHFKMMAHFAVSPGLVDNSFWCTQNRQLTSTWAAVSTRSIQEYLLTLMDRMMLPYAKSTISRCMRSVIARKQAICVR